MQFFRWPRATSLSLLLASCAAPSTSSAPHPEHASTEATKNTAPVTDADLARALTQAITSEDTTRAAALASERAQLAPSPRAWLDAMKWNNALADMQSDNGTKAREAIARSLAAGAQLSPAANQNAMRGEWLYLRAEARALLVRLDGVSGIGMLSDVARDGEEAMTLLPEYEGGAPLRLMAMVWLKAPSWPSGPGDSERGGATIKLAVERYPQRAENWIHYADALLDAGRIREAGKVLEHAAALLKQRPSKRCQKLFDEQNQRAQDLNTRPIN